jgi:hypothetical protein
MFESTKKPIHTFNQLKKLDIIMAIVNFNNGACCKRETRIQKLGEETEITVILFASGYSYEDIVQNKSSCHDGMIIGLVKFENSFELHEEICYGGDFV